MSARILVVDDEPDGREVLSEVLELGGYSVLCAGSGNEALKVLEKEPVDLILTDLRMPDGDGLFLLREVRHQHATRPIVAFISGYADIPAEQTEELGPQRIFEKPYGLDELLAGVGELLHR